MKRFKHSLSHYRLLTCDMGKLIPIGCVEALPGDTFQQSTSALIRMSPMLAPVMHPVSVRIHHWFVPNRLVYDGWEDFITGGPDGTGSAIPYPTNIAPFTPVQGDILDYFGVPVGTQMATGDLSLIPTRGYNKIFNEFYRDEDLQAEIDQDQTIVQNVAWEKDYFTSARPWAQKGPGVTLPLGETAPVVSTQSGVLFQGASSGGTDHQLFAKLTSGDMFANSWNKAQDSLVFGTQTGLETDLTSATATDVNTVRRAFALQRYQEARAQYGSRYTEYLRYLGIRPADARLQRPEYLGGGKQTIAFSEVLRTGDGGTPSTTSPIGELLGHGITGMRSNRYRYFCQEHGYIHSMLSVRPRTMYQDGLPRTWSRRTKEDYFQKELELIGQQEIKNSEIFYKGSSGDVNTFGYQDRYSEYRHEFSKVSGEFRDLLDYWHLGRKFADLPTLNSDFTDCNPSKRIFAENTQNSCYIMVSHSIQARRMLGKRTIGRIS